jgi:hypothetical protein
VRAFARGCVRSQNPEVSFADFNRYPPLVLQMNNQFRSGLIVSLLFSAMGGGPAFAAAPVLGVLRLEPDGAGQAAILRVATSDDPDPTYLLFSVATVGSRQWQEIGEVLLDGSEGTVEMPWTPPHVGIYKIKATTEDLYSTAETEATFEVFTGHRGIRNGMIAQAINRELNKYGSIATNTTPADFGMTESPPLIYWSGGTTLLTRGFQASPETFFWATTGRVDNGDSDTESGVQIKAGANIGSDSGINGLTAGPQDTSDGKSKRDDQRLAKDKKAIGRSAAASATAGFQLVLERPTGRLGVNTETLEASAAL